VSKVCAAGASRRQASGGEPTSKAAPHRAPLPGDPPGRRRPRGSRVSRVIGQHFRHGTADHLAIHRKHASTISGEDMFTFLGRCGGVGSPANSEFVTAATRPDARSINFASGALCRAGAHRPTRRSAKYVAIQMFGVAGRCRIGVPRRVPRTSPTSRPSLRSKATAVTTPRRSAGVSVEKTRRDAHLRRGRSKLHQQNSRQRRGPDREVPEAFVLDHSRG